MSQYFVIIQLIIKNKNWKFIATKAYFNFKQITNMYKDKLQ